MNVRFNPSANGPLHVGHIYMALVNEHLAHSTGGEFHVRFQDGPVWLGWNIPDRSPEDSLRIAHQQLDTLREMELIVDSVSYQSAMEEEMYQFLAERNFRLVIDNAKRKYHSGSKPIIISNPDIHGFPLSAQHTLEKVVLDHMDGSDAMVRGYEWIQEHWLYTYFCALFGFRYPTCYYGPRLLMAEAINSYPRYTDEISKTIGNWRVKDLMDYGITPTQIRRLLRESCLIDPSGLWSVDNIKNQPRLVVRSKEDVPR